MKRKKVLEIAIKAAGHRIEQLNNAVVAKYCLLCDAFQDAHCEGCPIDCGNEDVYSCAEYGDAVEEIISALEMQVAEWNLELASLKK